MAGLEKTPHNDSKSRKRGHHYVWRRYLRPWAYEEKIHALIDGKLVNPSLMGVAKRRDFYKFQRLMGDDVNFLRMLVVERATPDIRELHEGTLRTYLAMQQALDIASRYVGKDSRLDNNAAVLNSNFVEDWHSSVENAADQHLEALARGDTSFYRERGACIDFATYLSTQFLRTNRMRASVLNLRSPIPRDVIERTWTLLVHMLAANMAWHLFATRSENTIKLLKNDTGHEFITTDQPVINVLAVPNEEGIIPRDVEFYYPITPDLAILLGRHEKFPATNSAHFSWMWRESPPAKASTSGCGRTAAGRNGDQGP